MRRLCIAFLALAFLCSCNSGDLRSFWKDVPLLETDIRVSESRLAQFAELAVRAPESEALASLDILFDRLKENEVAYYVYCDWMDGAFYSIFSPCRNARLYSKAVDRMALDGIHSNSSLAPFLQRREWIQYNQKGLRATVPGVSFGNSETNRAMPQKTLVLVLDLSCPSCREALTRMASAPEWDGARHIAICCNYGPVPDIPGWEYISDKEAVSAVFDPEMTPVYFVTDADGIVETPYTLAL